MTHIIFWGRKQDTAEQMQGGKGGREGQKERGRKKAKGGKQITNAKKSRYYGD